MLIPFFLSYFSHLCRLYKYKSNFKFKIEPLMTKICKYGISSSWYNEHLKCNEK
jgi:hypothetical protein